MADPAVREAISRQARAWLAANALILDTETTGLGDDAEVVELAVIDCAGAVLLDTLVRPSGPVPAEAAAIHGITDAMAANALEDICTRSNPRLPSRDDLVSLLESAW